MRRFGNYCDENYAVLRDVDISRMISRRFSSVELLGGTRAIGRIH